ncbi:MAG TPA: MarR family transcriptional regulator [Thermomicrobiales bacterium]|nr:MarR family transcriptional regulator [Thermomicrobiales bacterium]
MDETNEPSRQHLIDQLSNDIDQLGWRNLRLAEQMLRPHGLTFPQVVVLSFLNRYGPDMEMSRIASISGLPASTITSIMDRLVKRDLAERNPGVADKRSVTGSITPQGARILDDLERQRDQSLASILEGCTEDEIRTLIKVINLYLGRMESI